MNGIALEVRNFRKCSNTAVTKCGVCVNGTWQRRGYSFLNGCVAALSIDTGKPLYLEIMSKFCRICYRLKNSKNPVGHSYYYNNLGSASSMGINLYLHNL
ncbi:hypothetical protein TNCV_2525911 [Trichonephila clavipes]|nr:hypothetical protein TNCV_2525911 [Trichonephila clavipes]